MMIPSRRPLEAIVRDSDGRQLARCLISRGRYILGQERKNEIVIDESSVSGRHARLTVVSDEEIFIEDLGSANGTRVGPAPVLGLTPVEPGTRVTLGLCSLDFQRAGLPAGVFRYLPDGFLRDTRYEIGDLIVEGSTSTIHSAHDTTLGREVAIKILRPESQIHPEPVLRFIREAQITSQLQHPGVLTVYELGLNDRRQLYYTTRFVEGISFANVIDDLASGSTETLLSSLPAFQRACDAIAYAHSRGVVHTSLRPESISLGAFGEVLIINWCYARVLPVDALGRDLMRPVAAVPCDAIPSLNFCTAPEVAAGDWDAVSARSDVYSLGAILYRLATRHRPIAVEDEDALRSAIIRGEVRDPAQFSKEPHPHCPGGKYPTRLMAIIMKALKPNPEQRYQSIPELQEAISVWQSGAGPR